MLEMVIIKYSESRMQDKPMIEREGEGGGRGGGRGREGGRGRKGEGGRAEERELKQRVVRGGGAHHKRCTATSTSGGTMKIDRRGG